MIIFCTNIIRGICFLHLLPAHKEKKVAASNTKDATMTLIIDLTIPYTKKGIRQPKNVAWSTMKNLPKLEISSLL